MAKTLVGVVVGYIVFMVVMFALMAALYFAVGPEQVFHPGTFQITPLWIALAFLVSLVAGMAGGYVCSLLSRSVRSVVVLSVVAFILGILMCLPAITASKTSRPRRAGVGMMDAMNQAQAPIWMHLVTSTLAAAGVFFGGRRNETLTTGP
jgi:hypothetical protein